MQIADTKIETPRQLRMKIESPRQLRIKIETQRHLRIKIETPRQLRMKIETPRQLLIKIETASQTYLLPTEFEGRAVSYGPSFSSFDFYGPSAKRTGYKSTGENKDP